MNNQAASCLEPPPLISLRDYNGPLKKTVGLFARHLERRSVHPPHYKPGVALCSLELKDKFFLFVHGSIDPVSLLGAGFNAGLNQWENQDPSFGQGMEGYSKRFGASVADQASLKFFRDFAYPSMFHEDPRYYRLVHASGVRRFLHATEHSFVAHHDNAKLMFNYSEWLGIASTVALSNVYHPGNQPGFWPSARLAGYSVLGDMGFDLLREFWPEISRGLRLPFRTEPVPGSRESTPR